MLSFGLVTIVLLLVYCTVDNTLFKDSPEIRCAVRVYEVATVFMETAQLVLINSAV